jgi:hypothetical protein
MRDGNNGGRGTAVPASTLDDRRIPKSATIAEAVARVSGDDPTDLPPLYEVLDPDALEALLMSGVRNGEANVTVTFTFAGYDVSVRDSGDVFVDESLPSHGE